MSVDLASLRDSLASARRRLLECKHLATCLLEFSVNRSPARRVRVRVTLIIIRYKIEKPIRPVKLSEAKNLLQISKNVFEVCFRRVLATFSGIFDRDWEQQTQLTACLPPHPSASSILFVIMPVCHQKLPFADRTLTTVPDSVLLVVRALLLPVPHPRKPVALARPLLLLL